MVTSTDIRICETQGKFYQHMAALKFDMNVFSDVFMKSDFCRMHFDVIYSPYQTEFPKAMYELCMPEMKDKLKKTAYLSENDRCFAKNVGFLYRRLYQETSIPSNRLSELIPYDEIIKRFAGDEEWFEDGHRGETGIFEDIIREYNLPRKRYDSDYVPLTEEEITQIESKAALEHKELERIYLNK